MTHISGPLTAEQIGQFEQRGFVTVPGCFSREAALAWTDTAFVRLGYDPQDSATWASPMVHMPGVSHFQVAEFAPKAWQAMCQLLGGAERIAQPTQWSDAFIANFHNGADRPWEPPSAKVGGWHKDGDFFRHFLDSPEQGLLVIVVWSDIAPQGGGTLIAPDSLPFVAEFLAAHPEGILPNEFRFREIIERCHEFAEVTGQIGDVVLMHPFMLHASSQNHSGRARFITNPPVSLKEPMQFDRADPDEFSSVERVVLNALGVERLAFQPTGPRERIVPERVRKQQLLREEELKRLAAL